MKLIKKIIVFILISFIILCLYGYFIEPKRFRTNEISFNDNIKESYDGLKIVHFGDINYNKNNKDMLDKIKEEINLINPDLIFFTGDLINKKIDKEDIEILNDFFNEMVSNYGKYSILGENDYKDIEDVKLIYNNSDFILLDNNYDIIYNKNNDKIFIGGYNTKEYKPENINKYLIDNKDEYYKIVLLHEPDYIDTVINSNINLALSGHSLNGQINIPYLKVNKDGSKKYTNDYYEVNNTKLYITNGIGLDNLNIRFNNIPSINFYRINKI